MIKLATAVLGTAMLAAGLAHSTPARAAVVYVGAPGVAVGVPAPYYARPYGYAPAPYFPAYVGWGYGVGFPWWGWRGGYGFHGGYGWRGGYGFRGGYGYHGGIAGRGGAGVGHFAGAHGR